MALRNSKLYLIFFTSIAVLLVLYRFYGGDLQSYSWHLHCNSTAMLHSENGDNDDDDDEGLPLECQFRGMLFQGNVSSDRLERVGYGVLDASFVGGLLYRGEWQRDQWDGFGTMFMDPTWADVEGGEATGHWKNGHLDGMARLSVVDDHHGGVELVYSGMVSDMLPHGHSTSLIRSVKQQRIDDLVLNVDSDPMSRDGVMQRLKQTTVDSAPQMNSETFFVLNNTQWESGLLRVSGRRDSVVLRVSYYANPSTDLVRSFMDFRILQFDNKWTSSGYSCSATIEPIFTQEQLDMAGLNETISHRMTMEWDGYKLKDSRGRTVTDSKDLHPANFHLYRSLIIIRDLQLFFLNKQLSMRRLRRKSSMLRELLLEKRQREHNETQENRHKNEEL